MAPVRRHLAAAARRIVLGADRREQHLERRHAEREAERAIAVVREEPVVAGAQVQAGGHEHGLVPGAADLEECLALVLELDLLVVDLPRQEHQAVGGEQLVSGQPLVLPSARRPGARVRAVGKGRTLHDAANYGTIASSRHRHAVRLHRWDEIALEKVTEMMSQKIIAGEREMLAQIYLKRGALVPMHAHDSEQMTYILQGALRFLVDGEEIIVREGEVLHIPANVPAPGRGARGHLRAGRLQPDPERLAATTAMIERTPGDSGHRAARSLRPGADPVGRARPTSVHSRSTSSARPPE